MAYKPIEWNSRYQDRVPDMIKARGESIAGGIADFGKGLEELLGKREQTKALESGWEAMKETREDLRPLMDRLDDDFHGANLKGKQATFTQLMAAANRTDERTDADRNYGVKNIEMMNDANYKNAVLAESQRPVRWTRYGDKMVSEKGNVFTVEDARKAGMVIDERTGIGFMQTGRGEVVSGGNLFRVGEPDLPEDDGSLLPPPGAVQAPPGSPQPPAGSAPGGSPSGFPHNPAYNQLPGFTPLPGEEGGEGPPPGGPGLLDLGPPPAEAVLPQTEEGPLLPPPAGGESLPLPSFSLPPGSAGPPRPGFPAQTPLTPEQLKTGTPVSQPPLRSAGPSRGRMTVTPLVPRGGAQGQQKIQWVTGDDNVKRPYVMGPDGVLHPVPVEGAEPGAAGAAGGPKSSYLRGFPLGGV